MHCCMHSTAKGENLRTPNPTLKTPQICFEMSTCFVASSKSIRAADCNCGMLPKSVNFQMSTRGNKEEDVDTFSIQVISITRMCPVKHMRNMLIGGGGINLEKKTQERCPSMRNRPT